MGQQYGPLAPVPGVMLITSVDASARYIRVKNVSQNDVYVRPGPQAPVTPTATNSYGWHIQPWSEDNVSIETPLGQFDGTVYLLATAPVGLASTAGISTTNAVSLQTYSLIDGPPPAPIGVPHQADITSQPRLFSLLPTLPTNGITGTINTVPNLYAGTFVWPGIGARTTLLQSQAITSNVTDTYALFIYLIAMFPNLAGVAGGAAFSIETHAFNAAQASIGQYGNLAQGQMYWQSSSNGAIPWIMPAGGVMSRSIVFRPADIANFDHVGLMLLETGASNPNSGGTFEIAAYYLDISPAPGVAGQLPTLLGNPQYPAATVPILY